MTAEVLLFAAVIALSPFTLIPALFMQFAPRAHAAGGAFLAGWVAGVAVPVSVCVALTPLVQRLEGGHSWTAWVRIGFGALLVAVGIRQWLVRHGKAAPGWMRLLAGATPGRAFRLGLLLSLCNPKVFLLSAAAGIAVATEEPAPTPAGAVAAVALFTACAAATVVLPVLLRLVLGERVVGPLARARSLLERNAAAVMAVVIAAIGVLVLVEGLVQV
ncbi:GAP family protein [Streptomyces sp. NPDC089799]|uniref:GAP family protein n=1 Tax=Streptomyces sp. NPDC089799 TaxID=3155066 RepID=UPI00344671BD